MLAAAVLGAADLAAQSSADLIQIETAAARRALQGVNIARSMIQVEPSYATSRAVPGAASSRARPAERTQAILDAVLVPSPYRRPYGETLLVLSEPQVRGAAAEVTTTLYVMSANGRRSFHTLQIRLQRTEGGWQVAGVERLGAG